MEFELFRQQKYFGINSKFLGLVYEYSTFMLAGYISKCSAYRNIEFLGIDPTIFL